MMTLLSVEDLWGEKSFAVLFAGSIVE